MTNQTRYMTAGVILAAAGLVFSIVSGSAAANEGGPPPPTSTPANEADLDVSANLTERQLNDIARQLADRLGITESEALSSLQHAKPILDFKSANIESPWFGSIWASYDKGYRVHVRVVEPSEEGIAAITRLSDRLGMKVVVSTGGASAAELSRLDTRIRELELDVGYTINDEAGRFDVYNDVETIRSLTETVPVHLIEPPTKYEAHAVSAGDSVRPQNFGWNPNCVAGFLYEGSGFRGYGTAGHCTDGSTYVYGYYSASGNTLRYENCAVDIQMKDFATAASQTESMREPQTGATWPIRDIAAGYYTGQAVIHVGRYTNDVRGSGTVIGWGPERIEEGGDCNAGHKGYLKTNVTSDSGDSGGPALLVYGQNLYLAGTNIGGASQSSISTWLNFVTIPGGGHFCTQLNPC